MHPLLSSLVCLHNPGMTDTTAVWDRIAGFWDQHIREGNDFQRKLIMPATDRLLGEVAGKRVLDACCGNGNYTRILASRGATMTAFDGSAVFIEKAVERTPTGMSIDYRVIDATSEAALATLTGEFDAVVCSMAIMDLSTLTPLLRMVRRTLAPKGCFVFSVCHPAFNSPRSINTAAYVNESGRMRQKFGVSTDFYATPYQEMSEGIINQPEPHPMFHRPIGLLLQECFAAGFVCDGFEEPSFAFEKSANAFAWAKRPEIPPAMVVRLR